MLLVTLMLHTTHDGAPPQAMSPASTPAPASRDQDTSSCRGRSNACGVNQMCALSDAGKYTCHCEPGYFEAAGPVRATLVLHDSRATMFFGESVSCFTMVRNRGLDAAGAEVQPSADGQGGSF